MPSGTLCQAQLSLPPGRAGSHGTLSAGAQRAPRRAAQRPSGAGWLLLPRGSARSAAAHPAAAPDGAMRCRPSSASGNTVTPHPGCAPWSLPSLASQSLPIATRCRAVEPPAPSHWCCLHEEPCPKAVEVGRVSLFSSPTACPSSIAHPAQQPEQKAAPTACT